MLHNNDYIDQSEPICFNTYKEAKSHLEENGYISEPILIGEEEEDEKFGRVYEIVDRFQSGKVEYRKRW